MCAYIFSILYQPIKLERIVAINYKKSNKMKLSNLFNEKQLITKTIVILRLPRGCEPLAFYSLQMLDRILNIFAVYDCFNSPAGAERRARVLIPQENILNSGIVTEHSGIQSCPISMSSTLDGFVSYAHARNWNVWRLDISSLLIGWDKKFEIQ